MKRTQVKSGACILGLVALLSACKDARVDDILSTQTEQQKNFADYVTQFESRLEALEKRPRLDFTVIDTEINLNEKMFEPLLVSSARLTVKGEHMPPTFYVDVMLKVEIPHLKYESVERQIFPVVDGRGKVEMQQKLPQHGLTLEQIQVTLKPMTWYRGQIINDDMVNYR